GESVRLVAKPGEEVQLARVLAQDDRVLLAGKADALGAALALALDEAALLPRASGARRGRLDGIHLPIAADLRHLRLRPRFLRPGLGDAEALAGREALLVLQDAALRQPC